jgi:predicted Fe-Mo cluster-binding NifX family protein
MDANLEPRLQSEIKEKINEIYGVKGVGEVKIRQSGPFRMVECNIQTSPTLPLYRAHGLADRIENFVAENYEHVESVFIHIEPSKKKTVSAIIPVKDIHGMDSIVEGHFGRAPYFIILKINGKNIEIEDFYFNEYLNEKKHVGVKVIKAIIRYKLDILFTSQIGEISFSMLKNSFVDIYKIKKGLSVKDVAEGYFSNTFEQLVNPTHSLEESQAV